MNKKNSIAYWFPILEKSGEIPVPCTVIITIEGLWGALVNKAGGDPIDTIQKLKINTAVKALSAVADEFLYPAFLRSGHTSMKHSWNDTCFVKNKGALARNLVNLACDASCAGIDERTLDTWAIREFLYLDARFIAFNGMPIATEWRFFVDKGAIVHEQPYWPPAAFEDVRVDDGWEEKLADMNDFSSIEIESARTLALKAAWLFRDDGAWSLDVCRTKDGEYFVTDMALADSSFIFDPSTGEEYYYRERDHGVKHPAVPWESEQEKENREMLSQLLGFFPKSH